MHAQNSFMKISCIFTLIYHLVAVVKGTAFRIIPNQGVKSTLRHFLHANFRYNVFVG